MDGDISPADPTGGTSPRRRAATRSGASRRGAACARASQGRPDSEHEQILVRVGIALLILVYLSVAALQRAAAPT